MDASVTVSVDDAPVRIGNRYTAIIGSPDLFHGAMIVNRQLSGAEMTAVHDELIEMRAL
jgi:hypothetical protein